MRQILADFSINNRHNPAVRLFLKRLATSYGKKSLSNGAGHVELAVLQRQVRVTIPAITACFSFIIGFRKKKTEWAIAIEMHANPLPLPHLTRHQNGTSNGTAETDSG